MNQLRQLVVFFSVFVASEIHADTSITIKGDDRGEFKFLHSPTSSPAFPDLSDQTFIRQFELSGPVKAVFLKITGDTYYAHLNFPWNREEITFNVDGRVMHIGSLGGWSSYGFEYNGNHLRWMRSFNRRNVLTREVKYEYDKKTRLISKEVDYEVTEGGRKLKSIVKRSFRDSNPDGKCYFFKEDNFYADSNTTISGSYSKFTCQRPHRLGDELTLVRGIYKTFFFPNETLLYDNGSWLVHVFLDGKGHVTKVIEYKKNHHANFSSYKLTEYENLRLDQYGNWLSRKIHKADFNLGEQTNYQQFLAEREFTYH